MSERRRAALLTCAVLALGQPLAGQQPGSSFYRARLDSLTRVWRDAVAAAGRADSLARQRARTERDTVRVGALTIAVSGSAPALREAAAIAWLALDSLYGDAAQQLARRPLLGDIVHPERVGDATSSVVDLALPAGADAPLLAKLLLAQVLGTAAFRPDPDLRAWIGGQLRPPLTDAADRTAVYVELVTDRSEAVRRCYLGDVVACRDAMGLVSSADGFLRWYDARERQGVIRGLQYYFDRPETRALREDCLARARDDACVALLRSLPDDRVPRPLGSVARMTLVRVALELGGRGAYARLRASAGRPLAERLAAAAGTDIDSLAGTWRARILAFRPRSVALPAGGMAVAIGWGAFFALCGLRSSRWRLG